MPKIIEVEIEVGSRQALASVNDLKTAAQQLEEQLSSTQFGTAEFNRLSSQLKSVRNELKDVDATLEGLDKEQRATALVDTFNGLTGAVGAVSSAFIAFGADATAIEDAEKKLLGVIGVVSGLRDASNGLVAAGKLFGPTFAKVGESIQAGFTAGATGAQTFKAALISTGIGAAVIAVGFLTEALIKLAGSEDDAAESAKKLEEALSGILRTYSVERTTIQTNLQIKLKQAEFDKKSATEITAIKKKAIQDQIDVANKEVEALNALRSIRQKEIFEQESDADKRKELLDKQFGANSAFQQASYRLGDELAKLNAQLQIEDLDLKIKIQAQKEKVDLKEIDRLKTNVNAKRTQYDLDIQALQKRREEEKDIALKAGKDTEGIDVKFNALELERAKQLGKDLKKEVEDSQKRSNDKTEELLNERNNIVNNANSILNKTNIDAIRQQNEATLKSNKDTVEQIQQNLKNNVESAERTLEVGTSIYSELIGEYKDLNANNYGEIFDDQATFYGDLIKALEKYGVDTKNLTKEQIRERGFNLFKAQEDTQLATDQYYKNAIELLKTNFSSETELIDRLEKERQAKFDENQKKKLDKAVENGKKEIEVTENTEKKKSETIQFYSQKGLEFSKVISDGLFALEQQRLQQEQTIRLDRAEQAGASEAELFELRKKAFEENKKLALSQAYVTNSLAILQAFASQFVPGDPSSLGRAAIAAGIAAATGALQIALIQNQTFEGQGGGTGSSSGSTGINVLGGGGGTGTVLPQRVLAPTTQGTGENFQDTATGGFGGGSQFVVKTYVLTGDINEAQTADRKLQEKREL